MYLSRLTIDPTAPRAYRTLSCVYLLHQAVMSGFNPAERRDSRVLFRVEPDPPRRRAVILVQSDLEPVWADALEEYFGGRGIAEGKPFSVRFGAGQVLRFRLRANPTRKVKTDRPNGKREGLRSDQQVDWLERKLMEAGATLPRLPVLDDGLAEPRLPESRFPDLRAVDEGLVMARTRSMEFRSALFDGRLEVTDPDLLVAAVENGIGSAKGFGFGLLSLAPARG